MFPGGESAAMKTNRKKSVSREGKGALTSAQAARRAADVPLWRLSRRPARVSREFKFKDFKAAMRFVNKVAGFAEEQEHHPDSRIHWNLVELVLWTHDIGGLSEKDFGMAAKINRLASRPGAGCWSPGRG
jgi:4a-hydroxytetrahydrobiopterin dehydratase